MKEPTSKLFGCLFAGHNCKNKKGQSIDYIHMQGASRKKQDGEILSVNK